MDFKDLTIFLFPAYFIFVGFISNMIKDKPIDKKYGYRTHLSTKNKYNWYYSNSYMAKGSFVLAFAFIIIGFLLNNFVEMTRLRRIIFVIIEFMAFIVLGISLEMKLKTVHRK
ncbi:SdpI family protein [uncultured Anaerococcus sp.]|mgnify:CR=1 FL=1|uniref:SdpI family protein n=1 Tax=uncultured Anaerococcus sp. TaxID=293428 RepID=UPI0025FBD651|nr:SdpI family protein [uncultured Anaerococcus sp.]